MRYVVNFGYPKLENNQITQNHNAGNTIQSYLLYRYFTLMDEFENPSSEAVPIDELLLSPSISLLRLLLLLSVWALGISLSSPRALFSFASLSFASQNPRSVLCGNCFGTQGEKERVRRFFSAFFFFEKSELFWVSVSHSFGSIFSPQLGGTCGACGRPWLGQLVRWTGNVVVYYREYKKDRWVHQRPKLSISFCFVGLVI